MKSDLSKIRKLIISKYLGQQIYEISNCIDLKELTVIIYTYSYTYKEAYMKRTNIMLTDEQHKKLKSYAKKEGRTLGELVREALDSTYKKKNILEHRKYVALDAYQEGIISLGKLAEILGLDIVSARLYLKEKNIPLKVQDLQEIARDAVNA